MEDNEFPMDQLLMILLKHFYRGGIFIVGDLNMRLSSDEESVNADLFKKLRCDDSEAIEKVRELDLNTRAPLKDVGNFKVDYPYALPPSYDFGNFQMKSILSGVDGDDSKKRSVCMCNDAGGHLFSRWRRNDCGSSSSSLPSSPDFLKSFVVPQEFYLTLPTYITRDSATSSNWRNSLSKVQTFRRTSSNREWIEVSRNGETLDESDRCDVRCEGNSNYADNDVAVLIHDDTLSPGDSVFKIGYLDRMQSMTPADRTLKIDATLLSLQAGGDHAAIAFAHKTEFHVSEESLAKDSDVFENVALLRKFSDSYSNSQRLRAMLLLKNADDDMDLADDGDG